MSEFIPNSASDQLLRKKNRLVYIHNKSSLYPNYELKYQVSHGKTETIDSCHLQECTYSGYSGTFQYILLVSQPVNNNDILNHVPILNDSRSFMYTVDIAGSYPSYTVSVDFRYDSMENNDGMSFDTMSAWYTAYCSNVFIVSFGLIPLSRSGNQFYEMSMISISPNSYPVILPSTTGKSMFYGCTNFSPIQMNWNFSNLISMEQMFYGCIHFNPLSIQWDTSSVLNMNSTFYHCSMLNPPSLLLDTSKTTTMISMFEGCTSINVDVRNWDVMQVVDMSRMMYNCPNWRIHLTLWPTGSIHTDFNTLSPLIIPSWA